MKKSKYNLFVQKDDGGYIVYNMMTGAIGTMDVPTYDRFLTGTLSDEEISMCLQKGLLVPDDTDETETIHQSRKDGIHNPNYTNFRIWPTSACNARCYYNPFSGGKAHYFNGGMKATKQKTRY